MNSGKLESANRNLDGCLSDTDDDQRFVMLRNLGGVNVGELIVVENFFEELREKVGIDQSAQGRGRRAQEVVPSTYALGPAA
jgi:hypothetical protein